MGGVRVLRCWNGGVTYLLTISNGHLTTTPYINPFHFHMNGFFTGRGVVLVEWAGGGGDAV